MNKIKNGFQTLILIILLIFSSCDTSSNNVITKSNKYIVPDSENSILLLNRFSQKLVSYNIKKCIVEKELSNDNFMVYAFSPEAYYLTAGNSIELGFEIITIDPIVHTVFTMNNNEGIFPLTYNDKDYYFTKSTYDNSNIEINRILVKFDATNKRLLEYPNVKGCISSGVIIKDKLYYTVYNESSDNYNLYSIKYKNLNALPNLEKEDLEDSDIYSQNGELYLSNKKLIFSDEKAFSKASENYFIKNNYLIQYQTQNDGGINALLIDTNKNQKIFTAKNIIDFKVADEEIIFYCNGKIEKFQFN